jgi:hypothetical protein
MNQFNMNVEINKPPLPLILIDGQPQALEEAAKLNIIGWVELGGNRGCEISKIMDGKRLGIWEITTWHRLGKEIISHYKTLPKSITLNTQRYA